MTKKTTQTGEKTTRTQSQQTPSKKVHFCKSSGREKVNREQKSANTIGTTGTGPRKNKE